MFLLFYQTLSLSNKVNKVMMMINNKTKQKQKQNDIQNVSLVNHYKKWLV